MESSNRLDRATDEEARHLLAACCGSQRWIDRMLGRRPFLTREALFAAARDEWFALSRADWREAFTQHPRIGDRNSLRWRFAGTRHLSEKEQAGVAGATDDVLAALAEANAAYELKFGYIFIVCATGRSAGEMLAMLKARLGNDPDTEMRTAAEEQAKITELRLAGIL